MSPTTESHALPHDYYWIQIRFGEIKLNEHSATIEPQPDVCVVHARGARSSGQMENGRENYNKKPKKKNKLK